MSWYACQHPLESESGADDSCGEPAVIETDDLGSIHFLCAAHHAELQPFNDYQVSTVEP